MRRKLLGLALVCFSSVAVAADEQAVVNHYANLAHAVFEDALMTALQLQQATDTLLANPSETTLQAARDAWKQSRVPYQQSEVFRFGNPVVDDWEGQLNAWPLDEGLIDYVASNYSYELGNEGATVNIISQTELDVGGEKTDVSTLTPDLLASLNELAGSEANVATGYHAIEFLLWGQDLNGHDAGAGNRAHTDFIVGDGCTGGNCERRGDYLRAVTQLLVDDLVYMDNQWDAGRNDNYRADLVSGDVKDGLNIMLFGMGSLALGELAGERMKVALEANSSEDEHDCFSDNTHNAHFYDAQGIRNVYLGSYSRVDGSELRGPSLADLVREKSSKVDDEVRAALDKTTANLQVMVDRAEADQSMKFDQMIAEGNAEGEQIIRNAIIALVEETRAIEAAAKVIGVSNLDADTAGHAF